jgi:hypothetical protein
MKQVIQGLSVNRKEIRDFILTTAVLTGVLTGLFTLAANAGVLHEDAASICSSARLMQ